jgi:hypothetical protein
MKKAASVRSIARSVLQTAGPGQRQHVAGTDEAAVAVRTAPAELTAVENLVNMPEAS